MVTHVFQKFCVAESKRHVEFEVPGTRVTAEFVRKTGVGILSKLHESIWTKLESMSQQKQHSSCPRMMPTSWIHTKSLGSSSCQRAPGHAWHDVIWRMDPWRFDQIRLSGKRKFGRQGAKTVTVLACKGLQRFQKSRSWLAIIGEWLDTAFARVCEPCRLTLLAASCIILTCMVGGQLIAASCSSVWRSRVCFPVIPVISLRQETMADILEMGFREAQEMQSQDITSQTRHNDA